MQHVPTPAQIWQHDRLYWGTVARITPRDGFALYTNLSLPGRYDPNHAGDIRLPEGDQQAVITDIIHFYAAIAMDAVVYVDHLSTPTDFADQLRAHGFSDRKIWGTVDMMVHQAALPDIPAHPQIRVYSALNHEEYGIWAQIDSPDVHSSPEIMHHLRYQEVSAPEVTGYIAEFDGEPVGRCLTFCANGIARIEAVFVHEHARRRGVARQMVATALRDVIAQGHIPYLFAIAGDHAQQLYRALGMRTIVHDAVTTYVRPYDAHID